MDPHNELMRALGTAVELSVIKGNPHMCGRGGSVRHYRLCGEAAASRSLEILWHSVNVNAATLSPVLGDLFPPGALAAELRGAGRPELLLPEEAQYLGKAVLKRTREFAAGRQCAHRLLAEFGFPDFPITVGADRQPVWPESLVGSITHTAGFCAAVVAMRGKFAAIGVDSEVAGSVKAALWPSICTSAELQWLRSLPDTQRALAATLIFSAKEAFYKCQYPLVGERLNFHAARVEVPEWGAARGAFRIHACRGIAFAAHAALPLKGEYLFHERYVTAGIALLASSA